MAKNQTTGSTTTQSEPWKPLQPYLTGALGDAKSLYASGKGFAVPNFSTTVPFSADTKAAQGDIRNLATAGSPFTGATNDALLGMLKGGDLNNQYEALLGSTDNPHYETAVNTQADQIANDVNRSVGMIGGYGSDFHKDQLVGALGDFREKALSDQWNNNINTKRALLGDIGNLESGAVAAAPGAYEASFAPASHLAQVGSQEEDLASRKLKERLDKFNAAQSAPRDRLNWYTQLLQGNAGQGGTTMSTTSQPTDWISKLLGGGLLGYQLMAGA